MGVGVGATIAGLGLHDLLRQMDIDPGDSPDAPIHYGGPVEPRRGFVLHSPDWGGQDTAEVAGLWRLSTTLDVLRAIAGGTGPARWLLALGYAGWGPGQLDGELTGAGWISVPASAALLFDTPAAQRWEAGLAAARIDPRFLVGERGGLRLREQGAGSREQGTELTASVISAQGRDDDEAGATFPCSLLPAPCSLLPPPSCLI